MGAHPRTRPTAPELSSLPSSTLSGPTPHLTTRWPIYCATVQKLSVVSRLRMDRTCQSNAAVYVNYALFDTPLEDMYGGNVTKIDQKGVMDLAGGG